MARPPGAVIPVAGAMGGMAATALAATTAVALAVLTAVWLRSYRRVGAAVTLGLVVFGSVLLVENLVAVYFGLTRMQSLYASDPVVGNVVLAMRSLELVAVASLTYVTLR